MDIKQLPDLVPDGFSDESRVWVYQSSRRFIEKEVQEINEQLQQFYMQWHAHGDAVKGWAGLLYDQFIVVMADEQDVAVSGCSTDSSVRIIKSLERQYSVHFFDRMMLTFLIDGKPQMLPVAQVQYAIDHGHIGRSSLLFNNTVQTKNELLHNWLVPAGLSWLATRVNFSN